MATKYLTSRELMAQADALRAQALSMLEKERPAALAAAMDLIRTHGFAAADLGFEKLDSAPKKRSKQSKASPKLAKTPAKKKGAGVIRFSDGLGNNWTGFGPRPAWFKAAVADGKSEDALRV